MRHTTDQLEAQGRKRLQRAGTLPDGWIPRGALRDRREWPRTRRVLGPQRTRLTNRLHATVAK